MISPYRDNCWMIYWIDGNCRENTIRINPSDLALPTESFVTKYISPPVDRGCISKS